jgi:dipeptidyl aminopeptidase/acylaminoacyl peptidase
MLRCLVLIFTTALAGIAADPVAGPTRLLRTPTVSSTQIAFAYANNIWLVPRGGGMARRLTSFQGQTTHPHFSPDGKTIAFTAEYSGNADVYVVSADGGEPQRLTWHPGGDQAQGWTPDGKSVLFASSRATQAPIAAPRFWTVPLDNMGAEIAIGHSYVRGGDMPDVPQSPGGLLGADFAIEAGRYKITRIYDNESWNPDLRAPLAAPGLDVATGDYILAVNGVELRAPDSIYRLLDGTANRQTVLSVNSRPAMEGSRQITVVPLANEQGLRTRAWVESNRRLVDRPSNGQLAYVYVPKTGQPGYMSFNRYYFA